MKRKKLRKLISRTYRETLVDRIRWSQNPLGVKEPPTLDRAIADAILREYTIKRRK